LRQRRAGVVFVTILNKAATRISVNRRRKTPNDAEETERSGVSIYVATQLADICDDVIERKEKAEQGRQKPLFINLLLALVTKALILPPGHVAIMRR